MLLAIVRIALTLVLIWFLITRARKYPKAAWACIVLIVGVVAASVGMHFWLQ